MFKPLDTSLVDYGSVYKWHLFRLKVPFSNHVVTASILRLNSVSAVAWHRHIDDSELYAGPLNLSFCVKGNSHNLQNPTNKKRHVLSVKIK